MTAEPEFEVLAAQVRLRIAYVAAALQDLNEQPGLRRVLLSPRLTIYAHLYGVSEPSLLDVEANANSLEEVFAAHTSHLAVVRDFNVSNGTNVRLLEGESIICCGDSELVTMKLTHDGVITYREPDESLRLLEQVLDLLNPYCQDTRSIA